MEYLENLTNQIITELENKPWETEFEEGFLSIPMLWDDITLILENKDLDLEILRDFYDKDNEIIKKIKGYIKRQFARLGLKDVETNWEKEWDEGFLSFPRLIKDTHREDLRSVFGVGGTFIPFIKKELLELIKTSIRASLDNNFNTIIEESDIL